MSLTREQAKEEGYVWFCLACHKIYKEKRTEQYEDGHGGRKLEMCSCGCDLFDKLKLD